MRFYAMNGSAAKADAERKECGESSDAPIEHIGESDRSAMCIYEQTAAVIRLLQYTADRSGGQTRSLRADVQIPA